NGMVGLERQAGGVATWPRRIGCPVGHGRDAAVFVDGRRIRRGECWCLVDEVGGDGEGLRRRGVLTAVGRAAGILGVDGEGGRTVLVDRQRVDQRATGRHAGLAASGE